MSAMAGTASYCPECGEPVAAEHVVASDEPIHEDAMVFENPRGHLVVEGTVFRLFVHADTTTADDRGDS